MLTLTSLLVGSHFRPPAQLLLSHLPAGAELRLQPEPENEYDGNALKVLMSVSEIPESQFPVLESELPNCGVTLEQLMSSGEVFLGYVAKSGGGPLQKSGLQAGNAEFLKELERQESVELAFGPDGKPWVQMRYRES